jgi:pimeloyl-ACP methyl ester carboxylesterase
MHRFESVEEALEGIRQVHRDLGRIVADEGVDVARHVDLGGVPQWVSIRGQDRRAPLLLFLHGGPGDPVSDIAYAYQRPWEDFFTVVNWDQRGFGRSSGSPSDAETLLETLTREQYLADAIELIDWLRAGFDQQRVIVVGQSWGTVLALELAHRRPDLLHAVVLQGLAVNWLASPALLYEALLEEARAAGDSAEERRLVELGPLPPVSEVDELFAWAVRLGRTFPDANTWHNIRGPGDGWSRRVETLRMVSPDSTAESIAEHALRQAADPSAALRRARAAMRAALSWDAERDVGTLFSVPIVVMMGRHDWQTHTRLARAYYERISAPWKKWVEFPHAAHALNVEQPGLAVVSLVNDVLPAVRGRVPEGAETGSPRE